MTYHDVYQKRDVWKGIAILWVIYFHLPHDFIFQPFLLKLQLFGYGGVDILLFASGLGCYYSLTHRPDTLDFMKRRILRILPAYWIFLVFWAIVQHFKNDISLQSVLGNFLGVQFFTHQGITFNWFIGGILLMYLFAPYFYHLISRRKSFTTALLILIPLYILTLPWHGQEGSLILVSRIPVFYLGMCFGRLGIEKRPFTKKSGAISLAVTFVGMAILYLVDRFAYDMLTEHGIGWTVFVLIVPGMCFLISFLPEVIGRFFAFFGKLSLEIFFMHLLMIDIRDLLAANGRVSNDPVTWFAAVAVSIPAAVLLKFVAGFLSSRLHFLSDRNIIDGKGE